MSGTDSVNSDSDQKGAPPAGAHATGALQQNAGAHTGSRSPSASIISNVNSSLQLLRHLPRTIDFDKSDYPGWAQQMSSLLDAAEVWDEVDPDRPSIESDNAAVNEQCKLNRKIAFLLLSTALKDAESRLVLDSVQRGDARTLWVRLRQRYQDLPPAALVSLHAQLLQARQERHESVQQFADRISQLAQRLRNNGEKVGEKDLRIALLQGLHESIASVVRSYYNSNRNATLAELLVIANGEEAHLTTYRMHSSSSSTARSSSSAALAIHTGSSRHSGPTCYNCHQTGHVKAQCPQNKSGRTATEEEVHAGRCPLPGHRGHMKVECRTLNSKKGATAATTAAAAASASAAAKGSVVSLGVIVINKVESTQAVSRAAAFSSSTRSLAGTVIDSGAGATVVPSSVQLLNAEPANDVTITVANGAVLTNPMRGTAVLHTGKHTLHIRNALQHPQVDRPLLSVSSLLKDASQVEHIKFLRNTAAVFTPAGDILLTATLVDGIYIVDREEEEHEKNVRLFTATESKPVPARADSSTVSPSSHLQLLHERLCHRSWSGIEQLARSGAVVGLEDVTARIARELQGQRCNGCAKAKAHRSPFSKQLTSLLQPKRTLGLVVADVAGPLPVPSLTGGRYFLLILDVFTQHLSVSILKHKSEAATEVKAWCRAAAVRHSHPVLHFHSDGGGEFITHRLRDWFKKKGTQVTDTPAHTPQHNGKVERLNRTILEWASACLIHAGAAKRFWAHAVATAVFVRNHTQVCDIQGAIASNDTPAAAAGGDIDAIAASSSSARTSAHSSTPQAAWFAESSPLSLSHLRVWGCDADVTLTVAPGHKLPKLTDKSRLCMFLGYDVSKNNIWCFYDSTTHTVCTARDATFYEQQFTVAHALKQQEQAADDGTESEDDEQWLTRVTLEGEIRLAQKISLEEAAPAPASASPATTSGRQPAPVNGSSGGGGGIQSESDSDSESNPPLSATSDDDSDVSSASEPAAVPIPASAPPPAPLRRSTRIRQQTHFYGKVNGNLAQARAVYINSALLCCNVEQLVEAYEAVAARQKAAAGAAVHVDAAKSADSISCGVSAYLTSSTSAPLSPTFIPRTFEEAWSIPEWRAAIVSEYASHAKNGTWVLVRLPPGRKAIGWKLVFRVKLKADGMIERYKARLTAKGYAQRFGVDYNDTFAPTLGYITLRVFFVIVAAEDLELHHIDVETAFLNATVEEEIYMEVPAGIDAPAGYVCRLKKALYGIKQAPHAWHAEIAHTLTTRLHYISSPDDCCLFLKRTRSGGRILFPLFVDDAFPACTTADEPELLEDIETLKTIYTIKHTKEVELVLGMRLRRDRAARTLTLDQQLYIERLLSDSGFDACKEASTPALLTSPDQFDNESAERGNAEDSTAAANDADRMQTTAVSVATYAALVGSLQYAAIATRPDIAYAVNIAARGLQRPTAAYRIAVERILRYLRGTSTRGLTFGGPIDKRALVVFTDANWAGDSSSDGRSTSGYLARIGTAAVSWRSKKQSLSALSSMESEYIAASECCREVLWLRRLLCDMLCIDVTAATAAASTLPPTPIACDSASAIAFIADRRINARNKHINVRSCQLRENITAGNIAIRKVSTQQQLADMMTKALPTQVFARLLPAVMGETMDVQIQQ